MAALPSGWLQSMLQTAVQSVQWTYSLFWQICPQKRILVWSDGYYNGPIKTRKTVQPMEVSTEEASLQRSQQLRELYDSLSIGETNQPARRPCAALSPEDLTESEWFYLMCISFSFPPGVGLAGKAYAKRQHVWLTGANEVESKIFSRAILAKSARIQTVVCIPLLDGVVEFGTTERVEEDLGFIKHVKTFFVVDHQNPPPPKPALSEHSTSNPATSSDIPAAVYVGSKDPPADANQEVDDEEDDDEEADPDSEAEMEHNGRPLSPQNVPVEAAEPSELMQLEMSEDIRLGSPDDGSNNLNSDFHLLAVSQPRSPGELPRQLDSSCRAESTPRWPLQPDPSCSGLPVLPSGPSLIPLEDLSTQEDTRYSETVSTILQKHPSLWSESSDDHVTYSAQSAFAKWTSHSDHCLHVPSSEDTSQWLLKYILFSVPFLHTKYRDENSPKSRDGDGPGGADAASQLRKGGGGAQQDDLSANHVLAERRRREKLNERFIILRSLVPFVTKMDKASILGDTIEYVKQLRKRIQDLEAHIRQTDVNQRSNFGGDPQRTSSTGSLKEVRSRLTMVDQTRVSPIGSDKRKLRIVEGSCGGAKPKTVESPSPMETSVQVSIIESEGLLELQCPHKEGLLLEVMQMLRELQVETTTVQSSLNNGFFVAELRAKVKGNVNGKKASIVEVKRAINQIIPHSDN